MKNRTKRLPSEARIRLLQQLEQRYSHAGEWRSRALYLRKKYIWLLVIIGTRAFKRGLDIGFGALILIFAAPIMGIIAASIKIYDGGPVFYISNRVGRWGHEFSFPKFRSMVIDAEQKKEELISCNESAEGVIFKMRKDPRVTPLGRILRRLSLDELPQLLCVMKGDMSLVGPRPPLPEEVEKYTLKDRRRLDVKPGLTCFWQVSGRSELDFSEQVSLDIQYIESQSLWLDLKLLLKTIPAVIFGRGAF